jgi:hypothetical protein
MGKHGHEQRQLSVQIGVGGLGCILGGIWEASFKLCIYLKCFERL